VSVDRAGNAVERNAGASGAGAGRSLCSAFSMVPTKNRAAKNSTMISSTAPARAQAARPGMREGWNGRTLIITGRSLTVRCIPADTPNGPLVAIYERPVLRAAPLRVLPVAVFRVARRGVVVLVFGAALRVFVFAMSRSVADSDHDASEIASWSGILGPAPSRVRIHAGLCGCVPRVIALGAPSTYSYV
jgi:hypothetical protein